MTYVFGGTLNLAQSINLSCSSTGSFSHSSSDRQTDGKNVRQSVFTHRMLTLCDSDYCVIAILIAVLVLMRL